MSSLSIITIKDVVHCQHEMEIKDEVLYVNYAQIKKNNQLHVKTMTCNISSSDTGFYQLLYLFFFQIANFFSFGK